MKQLLFRPGRVPKEYVSGKRISYLDPIRMYLFTSAVFFLVFFSTNRMIRITDDGFDRSMTTAERLKYASLLHNQKEDSTGQRQLDFLLDTTYRIRMLKPGAKSLSDSSYLVEMEGRQYLMVAQKKNTSTPISTSPSWLSRKLEKSGIDTNDAEGEINQERLKQFLESFIHKIPYILFVSLPFFALFLKLLYAKNKNFYYSDHAIFTLYHYIFSFLLLLLYYGVSAIRESLGWEFLRFFLPVILACGGIYLYFAMLNFYGQRWGKTLGKFLLLNFLGFVMLLLLFLAFLIFSILQS